MFVVVEVDEEYEDEDDCGDCGEEEFEVFYDLCEYCVCGVGEVVFCEYVLCDEGDGECGGDVEDEWVGVVGVVCFFD